MSLEVFVRRIVFDIETCAYPFEALSESQQEYLLRYAEKEIDPDKKQKQTDQAIRYTSLYPLLLVFMIQIKINPSFIMKVQIPMSGFPKTSRFIIRD
jgi:hypothetical protein